MEKNGPSPCMVEGCEKPGVLRCPICKAEGTLFKVCSQDCLNKIWSTHKLTHKAYKNKSEGKEEEQGTCMVAGCNKPGVKRCPICKQNGVVYKICSQTCLDKVWSEHKACHRVSVCQAQGCNKPGVKRCPMCKDSGVVFKVCSQECLDKIWPEHKKTHKEARCMVTGCNNPGVKRCPVCKQSGQVFKICSQECLDAVWAEHKLTHTDAQCMVPGCTKPGLKRCPLCKQNGKIFRICSQSCLDDVWPSHKKVHRKMMVDPKGGRIANEVEFTAYLGVVRMAIADDVLTVEKERMLAEHRKAFHISHVQHLKVLQQLGLSEDKLEDMKEANKSAPAAAAARKGTECVICFDAEANHIVLDCMHICLCGDCSVHYKETIAGGGTENCPICRSEIREIRKTFKN